MNDNQQSTPVVNEKLKPEHPFLYKKPKTSLFLDSKDVAGGSQSIPESNGGIIS